MRKTTPFGWLIGAVLLAASALPALAFETRARAAWIYDLTTGTVLLEKNAHTPMPPASMSKLMTINMLFEALKDGRVTLDERFAVSSHAKAMEGSTMFLNERDKPTVEELIKGIVVLSGNDACVVVAEGLAGTEADFAAKMNERAKALGLNDSHFANASGWPDPNHLMSMNDLGRLAVRLITEFPDYYHYFAITEFPYDGRSPDNRFNRNPLLKMGIGADGLKTGHTSEAGYGLVGSAVKDGRRVVFVISGLTSEKERAEEAQRVVDWAFREFKQKTVAKQGQKITDAPVWVGSAKTVGLVVEKDLTLLLPSLAQGSLKGEVRYSGPIRAPVAAGTKLADLVIEIPGHNPVTVPLVAESDVGAGGFMTRLSTAFDIMAGRLIAQIGS
ncbi:D-alanyl-D-alanine carboxypeptidase [Frigidibacter sp. RF13]|uniref:D-alanyl-D-alanine carboxypeptidase family protein n=1 Tax=Frigidibacter sp. RF13 TaxID=2997340 RepID=UPI00226D6116|nr:D-alanyl-D-alanine carboxypeptidase family protein [Frigidibacter sp. RF13]MCY1128336.1 D-alanyl-D-alanine carboxypeptidase [Frigidibacter sp. RF13]